MTEWFSTIKKNKTKPEDSKMYTDIELLTQKVSVLKSMILNNCSLPVSETLLCIIEDMASIIKKLTQNEKSKLSENLQPANLFGMYADDDELKINAAVDETDIVGYKIPTYLDEILAKIYALADKMTQEKSKDVKRKVKVKSFGSDYKHTPKNDYDATFLQFCVNYEELRDGIGNFTDAIIELSDGTVERVSVESIRFIT